MKLSAKSEQQGLATVEFAILASAFFLIVLGAIEVSRLLFTWNALDAVTQRAARVAAVCPANAAAVKRVALFDEPNGSGGIVPGFTDANLEISYLGEDFADTGGAYPIYYVRARIVNFQHQMALPFIPDTIVSAPDFSTTLPAESMGYIPNLGVRSCFGVTA